MIDATILFTSSNTLGGKLIRRVTGEPVSHCALQIGSRVYHSIPRPLENFIPQRGANIEKTVKFLEKHNVQFRVQVKLSMEQIGQLFSMPAVPVYDYGGFIYLGICYLLKLKPPKNLWQMTGTYLCTEYVTSILMDRELSTLTPYQLYLELTKNELLVN